jgi:hypothetical protein
VFRDPDVRVIFEIFRILYLTRIEKAKIIFSIMLNYTLSKKGKLLLSIASSFLILNLESSAAAPKDWVSESDQPTSELTLPVWEDRCAFESMLIFSTEDLGQPGQSIVPVRPVIRLRCRQPVRPVVDLSQPIDFNQPDLDLPDLDLPVESSRPVIRLRCRQPVRPVVELDQLIDFNQSGFESSDPDYSDSDSDSSDNFDQPDLDQDIDFSQLFVRRRCRQTVRLVVRARQPERRWTKDEDQELTRLYGIFGNQWTEIARRMNEAGYSRTGVQCQNRWRNTLNSGISRGRWTDREDQALRRLYKILGNQWIEIAERMPVVGGNHRTYDQCREHWENVSKPGIRHGEWTAKEDQMLIRLYGKLRGQWAEIARRMVKAGYNWTDAQCRFHWERLRRGNA